MSDELFDWKPNYIGFVHPQTQKRVVLVGTMHFGSESTYRDIESALREFYKLGFSIHYEGIELGDKFKQQMSQKYPDGIGSNLASVLGWVLQPRELVDEKGRVLSERHDLKPGILQSRLLRLAAEASAEELERQAVDARRRLQKTPPTEFDSEVSSLRRKIVDPALNQTKLEPALADISRAREEIAVKAALNEKRHVVLVWGAVHIVPIAVRLRQLGFVQQEAMSEQETERTYNEAVNAATQKQRQVKREKVRDPRDVPRDKLSIACFPDLVAVYGADDLYIFLDFDMRTFSVVKRNESQPQLDGELQSDNVVLGTFTSWPEAREFVRSRLGIDGTSLLNDIQPPPFGTKLEEQDKHFLVKSRIDSKMYPSPIIGLVEAMLICDVKPLPQNDRIRVTEHKFFEVQPMLGFSFERSDMSDRIFDAMVNSDDYELALLNSYGYIAPDAVGYERDSKGHHIIVGKEATPTVMSMMVTALEFGLQMQRVKLNVLTSQIEIDCFGRATKIG